LGSGFIGSDNYNQSARAANNLSWWRIAGWGSINDEFVRGGSRARRNQGADMISKKDNNLHRTKSSKTVNYCSPKPRLSALRQDKQRSTKEKKNTSYFSSPSVLRLVGRGPPHPATPHPLRDKKRRLINEVIGCVPGRNDEICCTWVACDGRVKLINVHKKA